MLAAWVPRIRSAVVVVLWCATGAVIVAAFFIAAFFGAFSPITFADPGLVILLMPLLASFVLGLLLTDRELVVAAYAAFLTTFLAIALILGFMFAPLVVGVAVEGPFFQQWISQRVALSVVILFPLTLLGTVVGRAVGDRILPPEDTRTRREALMRETREWHDRLSRAEPGSRPPPEEPKP